MPALAGIGRSHRRAVGAALVGEDVDVGIIGMMEGARHVELELAEAAAEGDEIRLVELLVGNGDDAVLVEGALDRREQGVVEGRAQIDAVDPRADVIAEPCHLHGRILALCDRRLSRYGANARRRPGQFAPFEAHACGPRRRNPA